MAPGRLGRAVPAHRIPTAHDADQWVQAKCAEAQEHPRQPPPQPLHELVEEAKIRCLDILADGVKRTSGLGLVTTALQKALYEVGDVLSTLSDKLPTYRTEHQIWHRMTDGTDDMSLIQCRDTVHCLRDEVHRLRRDNDELTQVNGVLYGKLERKDRVIAYIRKTLWAEVVMLREQLYQRDHQDYFNRHCFSIFDFVKLMDSDDKQARDDVEHREIVKNLERELEEEKRRMAAQHELHAERAAENIRELREANEALKEQLVAVTVDRSNDAQRLALEAERAEWREKMSGLVEELGKAQGLLESKERVIQRHDEQWDEVMKQHEDECQAIRKKLSTAEATLERRSRELKKARDEQHTLDENLQASQALLAAQKMKLIAIMKQQTDGDQKATEDIKSLQSQLSAAVASAAEKTSQVDALQQQLVEHVERGKGMRQQCAEAVEAAAELRAKVQIDAERISMLLQEKKNVEEAKKALQDQTKVSSTKAKEDREKINWATKQVEKLTRENTSLRESHRVLEAKEKEISELNRELQQSLNVEKELTAQQEREVELAKQRVACAREEAQAAAAEEAQERMQEVNEEAARLMETLRAEASGDIQKLKSQIVTQSEKVFRLEFARGKLESALSRAHGQIKAQAAELFQERDSRLNLAAMLDKAQQAAHREVAVMRLAVAAKEKEIDRLTHQLENQRSTAGHARERVTSMKGSLSRWKGKRDSEARRTSVRMEAARIGSGNGDKLLRDLERFLSRRSMMFGSTVERAKARQQTRVEVLASGVKYAEALVSVHLEGRGKGISATDYQGVRVGPSGSAVVCFGSAIHALQYALRCVLQGGVAAVHWGDAEQKGEGTDVDFTHHLRESALPDTVIVSAAAADAAKVDVQETRRLLSSPAIMKCEYKTAAGKVALAASLLAPVTDKRPALDEEIRMVAAAEELAASRHQTVAIVARQVDDAAVLTLEAAFPDPVPDGDDGASAEDDKESAMSTPRTRSASVRRQSLFPARRESSSSSPRGTGGVRDAIRVYAARVESVVAEASMMRLALIARPEAPNRRLSSASGLRRRRSSMRDAASDQSESPSQSPQPRPESEPASPPKSRKPKSPGRSRSGILSSAASEQASSGRLGSPLDKLRSASHVVSKGDPGKAEQTDASPSAASVRWKRSRYLTQYGQPEKAPTADPQPPVLATPVQQPAAEASVRPPAPSRSPSKVVLRSPSMDVGLPKPDEAREPEPEPQPKELQPAQTETPPPRESPSLVVAVPAPVGLVVSPSFRGAEGFGGATEDVPVPVVESPSTEEAPTEPEPPPEPQPQPPPEPEPQPAPAPPAVETADADVQTDQLVRPEAAEAGCQTVELWEEPAAVAGTEVSGSPDAWSHASAPAPEPLHAGPLARRRPNSAAPASRSTARPIAAEDLNPYSLNRSHHAAAPAAGGPWLVAAQKHEPLPVPASVPHLRPASAGAGPQTAGHIARAGIRNLNAHTQAGVLARPVSAGARAGSLSTPMYYEAGWEPQRTEQQPPPRAVDLPARDMVVLAAGDDFAVPTPPSTPSCSPPQSPPRHRRLPAVPAVQDTGALVVYSTGIRTALSAPKPALQPVLPLSILPPRTVAVPPGRSAAAAVIAVIAVTASIRKLFAFPLTRTQPCTAFRAYPCSTVGLTVKRSRREVEEVDGPEDDEEEVCPVRAVTRTEQVVARLQAPFLDSRPQTEDSRRLRAEEQAKRLQRTDAVTAANEVRRAAAARKKGKAAGEPLRRAATAAKWCAMMAASVGDERHAAQTAIAEMKVARRPKPST